MDQTQKLDKVDQLVRYSGLEQRRARELLEKCGWNVDSAYRLYKKGVMDQSGYKVNSGRYSEPVSAGRPAGHHAATDYLSGFGPVLTGMGPATHPAFLPPQPVPKFPVERPTERIIPIQIENRPSQGRLERQDAVRQLVSNTVPAQYTMQAQRPVQVTTQAPRPVQVMTQAQRPVQVPTQVRQGYPVVGQQKGDYYPNQVRLPPKLDNYPSQTVRGSKPVQIPVTVRNETFPNQQMRANVVHEKAKEQPKFILGDGSPRESSIATSQQQQQQQLVPIPKNNNVENVGSTTPKILKRGLSKISQNAALVDEERFNILHDISEDCYDNMYVQTFILPDVTGYAEDFRAFLEKDLIETSTLVSLEQAGRLNWWADMGICQRLIPMATSGDGNCLLHAASLAMWGIHDRQLMLRKALYDTLTTKYYRQALYRRWRWQQTQANKQAGLIFSEEEWKAEWDVVLRIASSTPRALPGNSSPRSDNSCCDSMVTQAKQTSESHSDSPVVYESLEEFHVFVLAHVIQRPIIVVADTILKDSSGEALAPIPFGGIYLPLECDASHCCRSPLLLTYDAAHFSALVPMEDSVKEKNGLPVAIPIVGPTFEKLPIHFSIDPGISFDWERNQADITMSEESKLNLLKRYLDMEKLPITSCFTDSSSDKNSTGSYESDDGFFEKKDKKKDNNKVSQQIQTVSKQFGSLGKTMGKKLKNLGKGEKKEKKRKLSVTQSSKIPLTISALGELDQQCVWCSKLTSSRSETHQKMIDNYLFDAGERFKKEKTLRNMKNNEIISRVHVNNKNNGPTVSERTPCVTSGCQFYGNASTSYLCARCFEEHKRQALDHEKDMYDTYTNNRNSKHHDDAKKFGKSKFYDMQEGTELVNDRLSKMSLSDSSSKQEKVKNIPEPFVVDLRGKQADRNSREVQHPYPREPSPDYDNVQYGSVNQQALKPGAALKQNAMQIQPNSPKLSKSPKLQPKVEKKEAGMKCRNANCDFYGNKDMDYFCSGCYKSRPLVDLSTV